MKVCTVEDCERASISRGWCTLHYQRWRSNGDHPLVLQYRPSVDERFWGNVQRQEGGCWTWVGSITNSGYGVISVSNRRVLAHRWAYETLVREIPEGLHLDHLCRTRACVNPKHLDVVTPRENVMRGMSPSAVIRRQGVCKYGHPMVGDNVYVPPKKPQHQQCRTCRRLRAQKVRTAA